MSDTNAVKKPPNVVISTILSFFTWVKPALKSRRALKTWLRCCLVLCATIILLVDTATLVSLGQAGFFCALIGMMLPPSLALALFAMASFTLLLGMCIGWAWGCAAMAAGLSVRSSSLLAQQQQQAQSSIDPNVPPALQTQLLVFQGMFLDPRSSAVYGAFFFIGTFALGVVRAYIPKLALLSIFGSIVLDIMCSYGPLFPTAQYTLAKQFLIPGSYYVAIAIASLVFIFPESLNRVWLTTLGTTFLDPTIKLIALQSEALESSPSDRKAWAARTALGVEYRRALISGVQGLQGQIGMIDLELSIGRLGPGDLKHISGELKSLMFRAARLHSFQIFVNTTNTMDESEENEIERRLAPDRFLALRRQIREHEAKHGHDIDALLPLLAEASADLRAACDAGMKGVAEWFTDCNDRRWRGFFAKLDKTKVEQRHQKLVDELGNIHRALEEFRKVQRLKLLRPFEKFFDSSSGQLLESTDMNPFAMRSLFICFVFSDTLDAFAERLAKILTLLVSLDGRRPKPRLWTPSGFGMIGRKIMSRYDVDETVVPLAMGTSSDPTAFNSNDSLSGTIDEEEEEEAEDYGDKPYRRNPDALPPTSALGRFFLRLGSVFKFLKSAEGIFALRHAVVSLALWIPSVCQSSAWFYYRNRGIWALIMAQTGLAVYAGDQIAGFVVRITGTIFGLLYGMAIWYIGAGHGDGHPAPVAIATTILISPIILGRLNSPPQQMMFWTMACVTVVFIIGYSWVDTHLLLVANSGVGVALGWKRALLVIIGFTAGFIVMMFPRPTSSRTLVRGTLSASIEELGHLFAGEVEAFLAEEARARKGHYEKVEFLGEQGDEHKVSPKERRVRKLAKRIFAISSRLQGLVPSLATARFEPQVQGIWPHEQYRLLHETLMKLLASLILLTGAFSRLDTKWCSILVHRTPFLNPNFLSDVFSNISILSHALARAYPIPASFPSLRDRLIYHDSKSSNRTPQDTQENKPADSDSSEAGANPSDDTLDFRGGKVDGASIGFSELTLHVLADEQLPVHATAVVALSNVVALIDETATIVRTLCGETTFRGFVALQKDYLEREERGVGGGFTISKAR